MDKWNGFPLFYGLIFCWPFWLWGQQNALDTLLSHEPVCFLPAGAHQIQVGINLGETSEGQGTTGISAEYTYSWLVKRKLYVGLTSGWNQPDPISRYVLVPLAIDVKWVPGLSLKHPWMFGVNSGYAWMLNPGSQDDLETHRGGWRIQAFVGRMWATGGPTKILLDIGYARQEVERRWENPEWWGDYRRVETTSMHRYQIRFGVLF